MKHIGLSLLIGVMLVGCYNRVQFPSGVPSEESIEHTKIFLLWGLLGEENYELYEDCPSGGVYEINVHTGFLQGAFTLLTLGLYSPRTIEITCTESDDSMPSKKSNETMRDNSEAMDREDDAESMDGEEDAESMDREEDSESTSPSQKKPKAYDVN